MCEQDFEFDFALSFAGQDRPVAAQLALQLQLGGATVFYDHYYRSRLLGRKLHREIRLLYGSRSRFVVPLVSSHYLARYFPVAELVAAKLEEDSRESEFILPIRLDDTLVPGLDSDVCYADVREQSIEQIADVLLAKLRDRMMGVGLAPSEWVGTFGVLVEEVLENWDIPVEVRCYPVLCDWLEQDLIARLQSTDLQDLYQPEASQRDGECLSVRIAFRLQGVPETLDFGELAWWDLLELAPFRTVYGPDG